MKKKHGRTAKKKNREKKKWNPTTGISATARVAELIKENNALKLVSIQMLNQAEERYMWLHRRSKAWKNLAKKFKNESNGETTSTSE